MSIGLLNESPLHQALKALYCAPGARQEVAIDGFIADVLGADEVIYEIQTAGFGALRRKLDSVLDRHRVVLVHPIAVVRHIIKLSSAPDQPATRRRSPKRGSAAQVLAELVSVPRLLEHPNFELELVLIEVEEFRRHDPGRVRRRNGWRVVERCLGAVLERQRLTCSRDLFRFLKTPLPETFTTADLALSMGEPRWLAQKLAFCLRESGILEVCGKQRNALRYRLSIQTID